MAKRSGPKGFILTIALVLAGVVAGIVIAVLFFAYILPGKESPKGPQTKLAKHIPEEISKTPPRPDVKIEPQRPRVAIVIDDMGSDLKRLRELFKVDAQITVAVLPRLRHSKKTAVEAHDAKGWEVILHLPMEPKGFDAGETGKDPGAGALLTSMSLTDVRAQVEEDIKEVPYADGVNNHMGSKFTEDEARMRAVLEVVKGKQLLFLDSRTTARSVAGRVASEMGVRSAERAVFLDNTRDVGYIKGQLKTLAAEARHKGSAIAIGHPYPETITALRESVGALKESGIEVVRLSDLAK